MNFIRQKELKSLIESHKKLTYEFFELQKRYRKLSAEVGKMRKQTKIIYDKGAEVGFKQGKDLVIAEVMDKIKKGELVRVKK